MSGLLLGWFVVIIIPYCGHIHIIAVLISIPSWFILGIPCWLVWPILDHIQTHVLPMHMHIKRASLTDQHHSLTYACF